ncbi:MAG: hypothetical protein ACM3YN_04610 [Parcubacteria group bacterium]
MRVFHAVMLAAAMLFGLAAGPGCRAFAASKQEAPKESSYVWTRVTSRAGLPGGANFPVFASGRAYALHPDHTWSTIDGRIWKSESLPDSGLNTAYLSYVQHNGAIYALGAMKGTYTDFVLDPTIRRTSDFKKWEVVGQAANLPKRVFYAVVSFKGWIWLLGGDDGKNLYNDVWRSRDGIEWQLVADHAPWSPRTSAHAFVFHDQLWMIGGSDASGLTNDVWTTADGLQWQQTTAQIASPKPYGYTPLVYDNKMWLLGVDSDDDSSSGRMMVSEDGTQWRPINAPWSARSGVAAWVMDNAIFITGGVLPGEGDTVYSREVWRMDR